MIFNAAIGLKSRTALVPLVLAVTETIRFKQRMYGRAVQERSSLHSYFMG